MTTMRARAIAFVATCAGLCLMASCAQTSMRQPSRENEGSKTAATFHLVRHAEKATMPADDPALNDAGQERARGLATLLQAAPPTAIYSTDYARTRSTAAPTAERYGRTIDIYDARRPAAEFAKELRRRHVGGGDVVLVVGHSNTVPALAEALCACSVAPMDEAEFDRHIVIRFDADGDVGIEQRRY